MELIFKIGSLNLFSVEPKICYLEILKFRVLQCKYSVDYHPISSGLNTRIHPPIFLQNPQGFTSQNICWIFSQTCIFMSLGEISNLCYSHLQNKKFNLDIFTHAPFPPPHPALPRFLSSYRTDIQDYWSFTCCYSWTLDSLLKCIRLKSLVTKFTVLVDLPLDWLN